MQSRQWRRLKTNVRLVSCLTVGLWSCAVWEVVASEPIPASSEAAVESISSEGTPTHQTDSDAEQIRSSLERHVEQMFAEMSPEARRGYDFLTGKVYLPADYNEQVLTRLDEQALDTPLSGAQPVSRRHATWRAFGIAPRHDDASKPLQYVATEDGQFVMNCFACHGGNTFGTTFPGAPNTMYALESLTESVRRIKLKENIKLTHMDLGSIFMPLGTTVGSSNAVMFGVALMNFRDKDLNVVNRTPPAMTHHDMDTPPWWQFSRN